MPLRFLVSHPLLHHTQYSSSCRLQVLPMMGMMTWTVMPSRSARRERKILHFIWRWTPKAALYSQTSKTSVWRRRSPSSGHLLQNTTVSQLPIICHCRSNCIQEYAAASPRHQCPGQASGIHSPPSSPTLTCQLAARSRIPPSCKPQRWIPCCSSGVQDKRLVKKYFYLKSGKTMTRRCVCLSNSTQQMSLGQRLLPASSPRSPYLFQGGKARDLQGGRWWIQTQRPPLTLMTIKASPHYIYHLNTTLTHFQLCHRQNHLAREASSRHLCRQLSPSQRQGK